MLLGLSTTDKFLTRAQKTASKSKVWRSDLAFGVCPHHHYQAAAQQPVVSNELLLHRKPQQKKTQGCLLTFHLARD